VRNAQNSPETLFPFHSIPKTKTGAGVIGPCSSHFKKLPQHIQSRAIHILHYERDKMQPATQHLKRESLLSWSIMKSLATSHSTYLTILNTKFM
jgi:hypothetical protein